MAKQIIDNYSAGETGGTARNKINANFTELYNALPLKINTDQIDAPNGVAGLDEFGKLNINVIPSGITGAVVKLLPAGQGGSSSAPFYLEDLEPGLYFFNTGGRAYLRAFSTSNSNFQMDFIPGTPLYIAKKFTAGDFDFEMKAIYTRNDGMLVALAAKSTMTTGNIDTLLMSAFAIASGYTGTQYITTKWNWRDALPTAGTTTTPFIATQDNELIVRANIKPSADAGNAYILGADGKPFVPQASGGSIIQSQIFIVKYDDVGNLFYVDEEVDLSKSFNLVFDPNGNYGNFNFAAYRTSYPIMKIKINNTEIKVLDNFWQKVDISSILNPMGGAENSSGVWAQPKMYHCYIDGYPSYPAIILDAEINGLMALTSADQNNPILLGTNTSGSQWTTGSYFLSGYFKFGSDSTVYNFNRAFCFINNEYTGSQFPLVIYNVKQDGSLEIYSCNGGNLMPFSGGGSPINVVQGTGTSTTDVMSQNAACSLIYISPGDIANSDIKIGLQRTTGTAGSKVLIGNPKYGYLSNFRDGIICIGNYYIGPTYETTTYLASKPIVIGFSSNTTTTNIPQGIIIGNDCTSNEKTAIVIGSSITNVNSNTVIIGSRSGSGGMPQDFTGVGWNLNTSNLPRYCGAFGYMSKVTDANNTLGTCISFGDGSSNASYGKRRLINVSNGIDSTDVATVGQLTTFTRAVDEATAQSLSLADPNPNHFYFFVEV